MKRTSVRSILWHLHFETQPGFTLTMTECRKIAFPPIEMSLLQRIDNIYGSHIIPVSRALLYHCGVPFPFVLSPLFISLFTKSWKYLRKIIHPNVYLHAVYACDLLARDLHLRNARSSRSVWLYCVISHLDAQPTANYSAGIMFLESHVYEMGPHTTIPAGYKSRITLLTVAWQICTYMFWRHNCTKSFSDHPS